MSDRPETRLLWTYPFRPFFLSVAAYAVVLMIGWIGVLAAGWPVAGSQPVIWHAHELLIGVVGAALAGFLLTAIANWTRTPAVNGNLLISLWVAWLAGRLAFWLGDPFAPGAAGWIPAAIDLLFPALLLAIVGRILVSTGSRRNVIMLAVLALLLAADGLMLFGPNGGRLGAHFGIDLVVALMVIIAGRITPAFTRNWILGRGLDPSAVRQRPRLDLAAIAATAGVAVVAAIVAASGASEVIVAALALIAAALNAWRLSGWAGRNTAPEPLLWVLHLGYAWIIAALVLRGLGVLLDPVPPNAWVHAAGVGAMGTLILGVMARVALGHTGRALRLPKTGTAMFLLITLAALARTAHGAGWLHGTWPLHAAAAFWIAAFSWYMVLYFNILTTARADGQPG